MYVDFNKLLFLRARQERLFKIRRENLRENGDDIKPHIIKNGITYRNTVFADFKLGFQLDVQVTERFSSDPWSAASFWLLNLEIYSRVSLEPCDAYQCSDCARRGTLAANNLAHVRGVNFERKQYAHFVHFAAYLHIVWIVHHGLYDEFKQLLVFWCLFCHVFSEYTVCDLPRDRPFLTVIA